MRPTTTSPTSPPYLHTRREECSQRRERCTLSVARRALAFRRCLAFLLALPRVQRSHGDEFVDSLHEAAHSRNQLAVALHRAVTPAAHTHTERERRTATGDERRARRAQTQLARSGWRAQRVLMHWRFCACAARCGGCGGSDMRHPASAVIVSPQVTYCAEEEEEACSFCCTPGPEVSSSCMLSISRGCGGCR